MGEPLPTPPTPDPITAILVSITEMRGELRAALSDLRRNTDDITKLFSAVNGIRDRVTDLEATNRAADEQRDRTVSARGVFWAAVGAIVAFIALLITVLVMARHGL